MRGKGGTGRKEKK